MIFDIFKKIVRPCLMIVIVVGFCSGPVNAYDILIGTSNPETLSYFTGRLVQRVLNKQIKGIDCKTIAASGDIHNLTNLQQGSLDMALIDSRMLYDAINKTGNFEFLDVDYKSIRVLTSLYDVPITLIVGDNKGISTLGDLKGKRINIGAPLSAQRLSFETILTAKHWSDKHFGLVSEISDSQGQDVMAFCHGTVDAMIHIGVHPDSSLRQLFSMCRAKAVHMNDKDIGGLIVRHPAFSKFILPSGTYPSQAKEIMTFATKVFLVASENLDDDTAYQIIEAIYKSRKTFSNAHPSLTLNKPGSARMILANLKLHTGALKYFSMP